MRAALGVSGRLDARTSNGPPFSAGVQRGEVGLPGTALSQARGAQAGNDQPVGLVFPLGNAGHAIDEATIGDLEKECVTDALGFVPSFRTHKLAGPTADKPFVLDPPGITPANPFWVVGAAKEVIDGDGGIWQAAFLIFIASLLFQHVQASRRRSIGGVAPSVAPRAQGEPSGDLAEFAKSIRRVKAPER